MLWGSTEGQMTRGLCEYRGFRYFVLSSGWFSQAQRECVFSFTLHRHLRESPNTFQSLLGTNLTQAVTGRASLCRLYPRAQW